MLPATPVPCNNLISIFTTNYRQSKDKMCCKTAIFGSVKKKNLGKCVKRQGIVPIIAPYYLAACHNEMNPICVIFQGVDIVKK